jgi:hypothetical protein
MPVGGGLSSREHATLPAQAQRSSRSAARFARLLVLAVLRRTGFRRAPRLGDDCSNNEKVVEKKSSRGARLVTIFMPAAAPPDY